MSDTQVAKVEEEGWEMIGEDAVRESAFAVALGCACTVAYWALHGALLYAGGPFWMHGLVWWTLWGRPVRALRSVWYAARWRLFGLLYRRVRRAAVRA